MFEPIRQDPDYHRFADDRTFFGIDHAGDVLSNLAFVLVGVAGLLYLWRKPTEEDLRPYWVFFAATTLIGVGSSYYHLAPSDARLVWDRLPMAVAFMSLLAAVISERVDVRAASKLLIPLVAVGIASVLYWAAFDDLRLYVLVQFGTLAAVLTIAAFFRSRYSLGELIFVAGALYGLAKLCELGDRTIYHLTGNVVSGHTLKHLLAAAALYVILWALQRRVRLHEAHKPVPRTN